MSTAQKENLFSKKFSKSVVAETFYNDPFLQEGGTSQDFFKSITYPVELSGLCKIKKTCYTHQAQDYCPIQVEIIDERLKEHYGGNFLLQVWDRENTIVFEKTLQYELASWNVFTEQFAFKLDPREAEADYFYVVELKKKGAYFKVKDFVNDPAFIHLGVCNACLYVADSYTIKVVDINFILEEGGVTDLAPTPEKVLTWQLGDSVKLHGFTENKASKDSRFLIAQIERQDNQLDICKLHFMSREIEKGDLTFTQWTEVVPRDVRIDPIVKYRYMFHKTEFHFGVALRESGKVDIYRNMKINDTTVDSDFVDVDINFQYIFLKKQNGQSYRIDTKWGARVGMETSEKVEMTPQDWEKIFFFTISNNVTFFASYILINTSFFVAHMNIISLFDIISKEWVTHFFVKEKVVKVFRNDKNNTDYNLGAYLERGRIMLFDSEDTSNTESWKSDLNNYETKGKLFQITSDLENYKQLYIMTKTDDNTVNLYGFSQKKLYIFNTLVHDLKECTTVIPFFSPAEKAQFILFNSDDGKIRLYQHYWTGETFYLSLLKEYTLADPKTIKGKIHTCVSTDYEQFLFFFDNQHIYKIDVRTGAVRTFLNQNVVGVQFLDDCAIYAQVTKSSDNNRYGFYIYDIQNMLDQDNDTCYLLDETMVGRNGGIDFSADNQRLAYMSDYEKISIVPALHRNVINFIGMDKRSNYVATKRIKDKFIALDKKNRLTCWSVLNGKLESQHRVQSEADYSEYEIYTYWDGDITYKREWYQPKCLLMKKTEIADYTDEQFYDPDIMAVSLQGQKNFQKNTAKKFHMFKLIEIVNETEVKEICTFIHPFYGKGQYERIFVSADNQYLLERLQNQRVFLYQREDQTIDGISNFRLVKRILKWPLDMSELTMCNYLFSPDLMYYLDYDITDTQFVIKETLSQQIHFRIPQGLMNTKFETVVDVAKRFMWIDSNTIRLTNFEGIEKIVDLRNGFEEIAYASVPKFESDKVNNYKHYYFHRPSLSLGNTYERLIINFQQYKAAYYLLEKQQPYQMYDVLFDVDYSVDDSKYKFVADLSFTFLHWRLIEIMTKEKNFNLNTIDNSQVKQLAFNILPGCNTILHNIFQKQNLVKDLYAMSEIKGEEFDVPFIMNLNKKSPVHLCMEKNEFKTANLFIQKLITAPIDHHGRAIVECLPQAIEYGLPSVKAYLDSRLIQTEQIKQSKRGKLNESQGLEYSYTTGSLWDDQQEIENRLFEKSPVDQDIKVEILDLPTLHCFNNQAGDQFFDALANTEDIDLFNSKAVQILIDYKWAYVKSYTIKRLFFPFIAFQLLFFSYSNFIFPMMFQNGKKIPESLTDPQTDAKVLNIIFSLILASCSAYFMILEFRQLFQVGFSYLFSIWNYLDLIPPCLILFVLSTTYLNVEALQDVDIILMSLTSLMMWFKFLYFLRIFKQTGYLIRMIIQVVYEMRIFLLVLMITVLAFSDAFITLSQQSTEPANFAGDRFIESILFTYRLCLGDMQLDEFDNTISPVYLWILFMLCSVLNLIVMFNLLIAIISESFGNINSNAIQASNQERARMIAENSFLIPDSKMKEVSNVMKYIIVANEINEESEVADAFASGINELKTLINGKITDLDSKIEAILTEVKKAK